MTTIVRRFAAHEWRTYRELRLRALAESPGAFGSTLEREAPRPDAEWRERLARGAGAVGELPLLALVDDTPAGLAWGRVDDRETCVAQLYQVWVAPEYRSRGVGRGLVDAVIAWARAGGLRVLRLGVTTGDSAAVRLYRRCGFVEAGEAQPLRPGSALRCQPMELALERTLGEGMT